MTQRAPGRYDGNVPASRSGAWPWVVAGAFLATAAFGHPNAAGAATTSFEVDEQAVVQVIARSASVTIHTWNRNTVQVEWPDDQGFDASRATQRTRPSFLIPTVTVDEHSTPNGAVSATLLPEDFPVPNLTPGMHDVVRVKQRPPQPGKRMGQSELTVTVPVTTGLVNVRAGRGSIVLSDYHGTTVAEIGRGRIVMRNVSGDAFVQPLNGRFYASESDFDRLRIRSNAADEVFDGCRVNQIEATTLTGDIIFDNGVFNPGLARFESDRGSIALGVNGGAQLGAHTQDGHVWTALPATTSPQPLFSAGGDADALQLVGNGGPLVNASSVHGNVFLYDGSLTDRHLPALSAEWRSMHDLLVATREGARLRRHDARR